MEEGKKSGPTCWISVLYFAILSLSDMASFRGGRPVMDSEWDRQPAVDSRNRGGGYGEGYGGIWRDMEGGGGGRRGVERWRVGVEWFATRCEMSVALGSEQTRGAWRARTWPSQPRRCGSALP